MPEQYSNRAADVLASGISNVDVSLTLTDGSEFPSTGDFRIVIENEIILVGARSSNTLSGLTRGAEGTVAAAHSGGAAVTHVLTRDGLQALIAKGIVQSTFASRPAAGLASRIHVPTDGIVGSIEDGSVWRSIGPRLARMTPPLPVASYNWMNQGGSTAVDNRGTLYLQIPSGAGDNIRGLNKAIPAAPYTIEALFEPLWSGQPFARAGIYLYDGTKLITFWWDTGVGPLADGPTIAVSNWDNVTTFNASFTTGATAFNLLRRWFGLHPVWFRIRDDNTNHFFEISVDRVTWFQVAQQARTAFLTATHYGVAMEGFNSTLPNGMSVYHLAES